MEEVESDLEFMPNDEIMSISRDDDDLADSNKELSAADEIEVDDVIDEILNEINTEDTTTIFSTTPFTERRKNIPRMKPAHVQALGAMQRFKQIQITRSHGSEPQVHLPQRMYFFVAHVHNLEPPTKRLKVVMDIPTIPTPASLNSIKPIVVDNIPFEQFSTSLFGSGASMYTSIPLSNGTDKGKGIA
nr:hypothetical protein [Tanacetum cinerariifolium]